MVSFFIISALLVVIALVFVVPVLFKNNQLEADQFDQQNIQIARDRLKELKQELENGSISQASFDQAKLELENNLALDLSVSETTTNSSSTGSSKGLAYVLLITVPVMAALIYAQLGEFNAVTGNIPTAAENMPQPPNMTMEEAITGLKAKLEQDPDNPEGWFMLARTYAAIQQYSEAVLAYEKTIELVGDNPNLLLRYADVLIMSQGGRISEKASQSIMKAVEIEPDNMQGLWMAGMVASSQGNYKTALEYWYRLDPMLNDDINSQTQLREQIANAETNLSSDSVATIKRDAAVASKEAVSGAEITVNVSLDDSLKEKISSSDVLFVYARAMQGPPMPLAAVKHPVSVLPVTVKLNDAMAMMPEMKLSGFEKVKISAVISRSGQPGLSSGDLYVDMDNVAVTSDQVINLVINKIKN